jgi:hypothetical protein
VLLDLLTGGLFEMGDLLVELELSFIKGAGSERK